ncbi:hypothetical protein AB1L30_12020 [Bremerella sp. JC817]|uniref:hypothetical protein n=1 Tax=Bremerella sp. JC817 TaxID=3231756 RepID=UPI003458222C
MRKLTLLSHVLLSAVLTVGLTGCDGGAKPNASGEAGHSEEHDHDHPSEGPHHGALIELGEEEYHAELVHDDKAGSVTIYLLDSAAKQPVAIEAADLTINIKHDGNGSQFKLPAVGAAEGKASEFTSSDPALAEALDHEGAEATIVVSIEGKQFRGSVEHDHDDHDHDH